MNREDFILWWLFLWAPLMFLAFGLFLVGLDYMSRKYGGWW